MVYSVGLTGNIASGKSTAAQIFAKLGADVISADAISKALTAVNTPDYNQIVAHFGVSILNPDAQLNRRKLREIIFNNPNERQWLENLLHPSIRKKIIEQISNSNSTYCLIEIPLLTSKIDYPFLNKILLITAPIKTQISRIIARDHCTTEQALTMISTQAPLSERVKNADDVLLNDGDLKNLETHVKQMHQHYLMMSKI